MSVDSVTGVKTPILRLSSSNISILDRPLQRQLPFYVGGKFGSKHLILDGGGSTIGLYLRDPYFKDCSIYHYSSSQCYGDQSQERATLLEQFDTGNLTIQSGDRGGDIVFQQKNDTVARLSRNNSGQTLFGLTPNWVRYHIDVKNGSVHVSDGYGLGFYHLGQPRSSIVFDSKGDVPIQLFASNSLDVPHFSISSTGNVGLNAAPVATYDFFVNDPEGARQVMVRLDAVEDKLAGLEFAVDQNNNNNLSDIGDRYQMYLTTNNMLALGSDDAPVLSISQSKKMGCLIMTPMCHYP